MLRKILLKILLWLNSRSCERGGHRLMQISGDIFEDFIEFNCFYCRYLTVGSGEEIKELIKEQYAKQRRVQQINS